MSVLHSCGNVCMLLAKQNLSMLGLGLSLTDAWKQHADFPARCRFFIAYKATAKQPQVLLYMP